MTATPLPLRADLTQDACVFGEANAKDLAWIYPDAGSLEPLPISLDALPTATPWDQKRTLWMVYADAHPETVESVLDRITECSAAVLVDPHPAGGTKLSDADRGRLAALMKGERLHLVVGGNVEQRGKALTRLIDINRFDGWKPVLSPALFEQDPGSVRDLMRVVSSGLNTRSILKSTNIALGARFICNALINAPWIGPPEAVAALADARMGKPALIVSAGPSLNKQLPILAQNQDLFTIIAIDPVWPILKAHGITPDFLVALDPITKPSWSRNEFPPSTRFVADFITSPRVTWSHDHMPLFTGSHDQIRKLLEFLGAPTEELLVGGSVATLAFNLAVRLGANPIVLIGQDLALTGGKDHAEGYRNTYDADTLQRFADTGFDVDGYYGGTVRTERVLLVYKNWFERRFKEIPDRMVINSTEGGARIEGSLQVPFALVCEQIRSTSLRKSQNPPEEPPALDRSHMARLRQRLAELRQSVKEYKALAERAESLTRGKSAAAAMHKFRDIDRVNEKLKGFAPQARLLVDYFGAGMMESIRYETVTQEKESRSMSEAMRKYRDVYRGIQEACDVTVQILDRIAGLYEAVEAKGYPDPALIEAVMA